MHMISRFRSHDGRHFKGLIKKYSSLSPLFPAVIPVILFLNGCLSYSVDSNSLPSLEEARSAVARMDLERARKIFQAITESDRVPGKDKVKAFQALALQDWRFYRDVHAAGEHLRKADSLAIDRTGSWSILSRIEGEAEQYGEALAAAIVNSARNQRDKVKIYHWREMVRLIHACSASRS